jgi:signal transduction histidine kinase
VLNRGSVIPEEALPRLFDRFYQVPGQSKPGVGIGLTIALEVVVAHGGSIACTSDEVNGTEFHFLIPVA